MDKLRVFNLQKKYQIIHPENRYTFDVLYVHTKLDKIPMEELEKSRGKKDEFLGLFKWHSSVILYQTLFKIENKNH